MYEKNLVVNFGHETDRPVDYIPHLVAATDLIASYNRYHKIGLWEVDMDAQQLFWSPETYEIHGLPANSSDMDLKRALAFYVPEDRKTVTELIDKAVRAQTGFQFKLRIKRADGEVRMVEAIGDVKRSSETKKITLYGTIRDITSQTKFENARNGQKELIQKLLLCLPIPAIIVDRGMKYVSANDRFAMEFNFSKEEVHKGADHFKLFPETPLRWKELMKLSLTGKPIVREREMYERANGSKILMDLVLLPWRTQGGEVGGLVMLFKVHRIFPAKLDGVDIASEPTPVAELGTLLGEQGCDRTQLTRISH